MDQKQTRKPRKPAVSSPEIATVTGDRKPPHSLSAEMSVLGAMLLSKEAIGQVIPILKEECFFQPAYRLIFQALITLYEKGDPPDPVLLRHELQRMGVLEDIGGTQTLAKLMVAVPSATNVEYYAKMVRGQHMLRKLITACNETLEESFTEAFATEEILDRAEKRVFEITEERITSGPEHLHGFLDAEFQKLEERDGNYLTGISTGFTEMDDMLSGLQNGELIIVAARPSMGKTAFGLNLCDHISVMEQKPVVFFSLEMSKQQVAQRMLCCRAMVDSHRFRRGMLNDQEIASLHSACDVLRDAKLYVDDTPGMSILELRAKSRLLMVREKISAVFVDYLQLMSCPGSESRQQEVSNISRGLKALAREMNVPVVALAQLNRSVEGRESHKPRMSDLRESGSIEQEADVIILLHREDYYKETGNNDGGGGDDQMGIAEIIVAKQRNGPVGSFNLQFSKKHTKFNNLANIQLDSNDAYIPPSAGGDAPF
jgi:replicative DNA helicase